MCVCVRAKLFQPCLTLCNPMVTCQSPLSMGFSRQECWSGLPFPPPGDLPPGIKSESLMSPALAGGFFTTSATWEISTYKQAKASLVAQMVKRLPTMWQTQVQSLGWEDPLEKEMATHSSALAWKIPWTKEPGRLQSMGSQRVRHD